MQLLQFENYIHYNYVVVDCHGASLGNLTTEVEETTVGLSTSTNQIPIDPNDEATVSVLNAIIPFFCIFYELRCYVGFLTS